MISGVKNLETWPSFWALTTSPVTNAWRFLRWALDGLEDLGFFDLHHGLNDDAVDAAAAIGGGRVGGDEAAETLRGPWLS